MALVDDRGRLFSRFNVVDVFVFAVVVVMIPTAFGAYALFRSPPARLKSVEPKQLVMGPNLRVRIGGANLRPFMRVSFNTVQGRTFMIGSTETAEVDLPELEPGTYDVVLYDYAQEVDRLPKAFTILPRVAPPLVAVSVAGTFVGVNAAQADAIRVGAPLVQQARESAKVLAVGARRAGALLLRTGDTAIGVGLPGQFDVPAALRLDCFVENNADGSVRCMVFGPTQSALVAPDSVLSFGFNGGTVNFQVSDVQPFGPPAFLRVRVRAQLPPDIAARLRVGDADSIIQDYPGAWRGRIESVSGTDVVLRLPAQALANGWRYRNQWLKINGAIRFETANAVVGGTIVELTPLDTASSQ
jgi:hypothetical protein